MSLGDSVDENNDQESPEPGVRNRSKRIRKIKHSDDFEYNNVGLDEQQDDPPSSPKKGKRARSRHDDDDEDFSDAGTPKKAKRQPSVSQEVDDEHHVSLKKILSEKGIKLPIKPKMGYVAYVTSIRDSVQAKYPQATFGDLTHLLAEEWNKLPQEEKKKHLDKAKKDKEEYFNQLKEIEKKHGIDLSALAKMKRRRSCKPFTEKVRSVLERNRSTMFARKSLTSEEKYKKMLETSGLSEGEEVGVKPQLRRSNGGDEVKRKVKRSQKEEADPDTSGKEVKEEKGRKKEKDEGKMQKKPRVKKVEVKRKFRLQDVPKVEAAVFTDDFLEINKGREAELRQLRKAVGDLEEQTIALRHHVTCLEDTHSFLEESVAQSRRLNSDLSHYVVDLSNVVVKNFSKLKLPECGDLTHGNIGKYAEELVALFDKGGKETAGIVKAAQEIVAKLELPA